MPPTIAITANTKPKLELVVSAAFGPGVYCATVAVAEAGFVAGRVALEDAE
jgi:hypothetical protein